MKSKGPGLVAVQEERREDKMSHPIGKNECLTQITAVSTENSCHMISMSLIGLPCLISSYFTMAVFYANDRQQ